MKPIIIVRGPFDSETAQRIAAANNTNGDFLVVVLYKEGEEEIELLTEAIQIEKNKLNQR